MHWIQTLSHDARVILVVMSILVVTIACLAGYIYWYKNRQVQWLDFHLLTLAGLQENGLVPNAEISEFTLNSQYRETSGLSYDYSTLFKTDYYLNKAGLIAQLFAHYVARELRKKDVRSTATEINSMCAGKNFMNIYLSGLAGPVLKTVILEKDFDFGILKTKNAVFDNFTNLEEQRNFLFDSVHTFKVMHLNDYLRAQKKVVVKRDAMLTSFKEWVDAFLNASPEQRDQMKTALTSIEHNYCEAFNA